MSDAAFSIYNVGTAVLQAALAADSETLAAGTYAATTLSTVDSDLAAANIKTGVDIFGITGTYDTEAVNPVIAARMKTGDVAFVNGAKITGSGTKTLSVANDTVTDGYYAATTLSAVDTDLAAGNIKKDVVVFGVTGTYDTSATPITAATVQTGLEGFVNGAKVTGSGTKTLSVANDTVAAGYYEATTLSTVDTDLAVGNIAVGKTIFGLAGTYTSDADAVAADIAVGKTAYVNGVKITGEHV